MIVVLLFKGVLAIIKFHMLTHDDRFKPIGFIFIHKSYLMTSLESSNGIKFDYNTILVIP